MISYPFESQNTGTTDNPVYDRAITAEQERLFNKLRYLNGVFDVQTGGLHVEATGGMLITVNPGGCHIEGALGFQAEAINIELSAAGLEPRIDRIIARFNTSLAVRGIEIAVLEGVPGASPEAAELTRESNYYEIALADIYVAASTTEISQTAITDQRLNSKVCGQVIPAIPMPMDTSSLWQQYQESLKDWIETVESAMDETLAGELKNQISDMKASLEEIAPDGKVDLEHGGTGVTTLEELKILLGIKSILPISEGGTGADNAEEALLNIGGLSCKEIWRNASPSSSFGEQSLSEDKLLESPLGHELFIAEYRHSISSDQYVKVLIGKDHLRRLESMANATSDSAYMRYITRDITITDTEVVFTDATYKQVNTSALGGTYNNYNIPIAVYIVKGVQ